jgi:carbamoyl-phosphate synthase large subunit
VLEKYGCELIGANARAIHDAEDRPGVRRPAMRRIGLKTPEGKIATTWEEAEAVAEWTGSRRSSGPSFTLGGSGGGIAYNRDEYEQIVRRGPRPVAGVAGARRALAARAGRSSSSRSCATRPDNVVIVCSIENFDPMGVHTGDSITSRRR